MEVVEEEAVVVVHATMEVVEEEAVVVAFAVVVAASAKLMIATSTTKRKARRGVQVVEEEAVVVAFAVVVAASAIPTSTTKARHRANPFMIDPSVDDMDLRQKLLRGLCLGF